MKIWLLSVSIFFFSWPGLVFASNGCNDEASAEVKAFGPRLALSELPFHYNFRLGGPFVVEAMESFSGQYSWALSAGGEMRLDPAAFYSQEMGRGLLVYRVMFVPKLTAPAGLYRFSGEVKILNTDTGKSCWLQLPSKVFELVHSP